MLDVFLVQVHELATRFQKAEQILNSLGSNATEKVCLKDLVCVFILGNVSHAVASVFVLSN
jgi:hypothetical protein